MDDAYDFLNNSIRSAQNAVNCFGLGWASAGEAFHQHLPIVDVAILSATSMFFFVLLHNKHIELFRRGGERVMQQQHSRTASGSGCTR